MVSFIQGADFGMCPNPRKDRMLYPNQWRNRESDTVLSKSKKESGSVPESSKGRVFINN